MDRREKAKVRSSRIAKTDKHTRQKLPARSDCRNEQNLQQPERQTFETERSCRRSNRREEFDPSSRCSLHTPSREKVLESPSSPSISEECSSSDSETSSATEPPEKNDNSGSSTSTDSDSSSNDSSSDSNDSSSTTTTVASNEGLSSPAPAEIPGQATNSSLKDSPTGSADKSTNLSAKVISVNEKPYDESMNFPPSSAEVQSEEEKQTTEAKEEEIQLSGYYLSSKQSAQQSHRPRLSKQNVESGAADSSTDSGVNPNTHSILHSLSGDEVVNISHIPLPSSAGVVSSLEPVDAASRPRNLVRIVMKKSGVTRGISAKKLTKNPVINIFGEIVFDGCTFEEESRSSGERASDILAPSEVDQKELDLNSEAIRNMVCNDILQTEIRREIGIGRIRSGGGGDGEDILQKGTAKEKGDGRVLTGEEDITLKGTSRGTEEERGRGEGEEDILQKIRRDADGGGGRVGGREKKHREEGVDRKGILGEDKITNEEKSVVTIGKSKESKQTSACDISKSLKVSPVEESTDRFQRKLVDYDDDGDVGSCQGRSSSEDESTSAPSSSRIATKNKKKDHHAPDGIRSYQESKSNRRQISSSFSRRRRHTSSSNSSGDERNSSEYPQSTADVNTSFERVPNNKARSSSATELKVLTNSDKFSDLHCSDSRRYTSNMSEGKWGNFDHSESNTRRRRMTHLPVAATNAKTLGTNESTDRSTISEVERDLKMKALASRKRSKPDDCCNVETKERDISDVEELKRRESRRLSDSLQSKDSSNCMSSSQRPRTTAKSFSPDNYRFRSDAKHGPHVSPTRATKTDRTSKSRRSETRYGETEAELRGNEPRRRSSERQNDFASGKERQRKRRRQRSRSSSDRSTTDQISDEAGNVTVSNSRNTGSRSTASRSEQSGPTRTRSAAGHDDSNKASRPRRYSTASMSIKSCPEQESCLRVGPGKREKTRHAEAPSPSGRGGGGGDRGADEGRITRSSGSGKVPSSPGGEKRTGDGRARPRSSRDATTDPQDQCSHDDASYHQRANYYPNDWVWSTRHPDHLRETPPGPYPFPYVHPFAQPFPSPMIRYNSYVYANYCNEASRRYFLAQQPASFYPNYHRPHHPYWAPPHPQNLHCPPYVPYDTTAGQGDGEQYEEDGRNQECGFLMQDEAEDHAPETMDDLSSATMKVVQELPDDAAIQSSAVDS